MEAITTTAITYPNIKTPEHYLSQPSLLLSRCFVKPKPRFQKGDSQLNSSETLDISVDIDHARVSLLRAVNACQKAS